MPFQPRMTPKKRAFLEAYCGEGEAKGNATEAARLAGFTSPSKQGRKIKKQLFAEILNRQQELKAANKLSPDELMEILAVIARDPTDRNRIKALELIAKIEGMLDGKLLITIDRRDIAAKLDEHRQLLLSAGIVDAEVSD